MARKHFVYVSAISALGIAVLLFCSYISVFDFIQSITSEKAIFSCTILLLMVLCRMMPIYLKADRTLDISFVPVLACVITQGYALAIFLFGISNFFVFVKDPGTGRFFSPLFKSPSKELFNIGNIVISIFVAGFLFSIFDLLKYPLVSIQVLLFSIGFSVFNIAINFIIFALYFQTMGSGYKFTDFVLQSAGGIIPNIACTIPLGMILGIALQQPQGYIYVILFLAPLFLARYSLKLYMDSKRTNMRTIASLSNAIEAKDAYTQGHSNRVAYYSEQIAVALRKPANYIEEIKIAALLHDVGKIGIHDSVLLKAGALTQEEFAMIKTHPVTGYKIIKSIHLSDTINDAVLYHHYNYDCSGYPVVDPPLKEQPLSAAILAVADCYDAMTTDRPYRGRLTEEEAEEQLKIAAGTQLNPEVVKVFLEILPKLDVSQVPLSYDVEVSGQEL